MMILNTTADIIDAIVERELTPIECTSIYKTQCVGCVIPEGEDMDGLMKGGAYVEHNGTNFVVYWPTAHWDENVVEYIATLLDPSAFAAQYWGY
jgi:hypothetical protein